MKPVREAFGLTQQQLANYVGLSRTNLSLAESENRRMGTQATTKCAQLLQLLKKEQNAPPPQLQGSNQQQTAFNKKLQARIKNCQWRISMAQQKLAAMQAPYTQCSNALMAVNELLPQLPAGKEAKKDRLWLELLETETIDKLNHCGTQAQQLLQLEIEVLEFEAARAAEMMGQ